MTVTTIGITPQFLESAEPKAREYVLNAVRNSDCTVDELVNGLCSCLRPPKAVRELADLAIKIPCKEGAIPRIHNFGDARAADDELKQLKQRHDDITTRCQAAAHQLISWLAANKLIYIHGDIVRLHAE